MKHLQLFSLCFLVLILVSCGSDIEDDDKIDGQWNLETISGGIVGGGFSFEGEISIIVSGSVLDMFKDDELIMEADISYSLDEFDNVILDIDRSYVDEEPELLLGSGNRFFSRKSADDSTLSLSEVGNDGFSFDFVK